MKETSPLKSECLCCNCRCIFHYVAIEIWEDDLITVGREGGSKNILGAKEEANLETYANFYFCSLTIPPRYNMGNMGNYYSLTLETMFSLQFGESS